MKLLSYKIFENNNIEHLNSELIYAVENNKVRDADELLKAGADVNYINDSYIQESSLTIASEHGYDNMVALLLINGADINYKTAGEFSSLMLASLNSHKNVICNLIDNGADMLAINSKEDNFVDIAIREEYIKQGNIQEWYKKSDTQRYFLSKCPKLYFTFKKHDILCADVQKEYQYIETGDDLNLL